MEAARLRQEALEARDRGDHDAAVGRLRSYRGLVERSGIDDATVAEEVRDLEGMVMSFEDQQVSQADVKYMKQRAYSAHRSRRGSVERYKRGD